MPQGLGIQLGLGGGRSATPSGAPSGSPPDSVLLTEGGDYMTTEDGFFLEFEL